MSKTASSIADRLASFGQSKFGSEHGWKARFALALGISTQHLNRYLSGSSEPGKKMFLRLIELGCDVHWLLTGSEHSRELLSEREREILQVLRTAGIDTVEQVRYLFNPESLAADIAGAALKEFRSRYRIGRNRRRRK